MIPKEFLLDLIEMLNIMAYIHIIYIESNEFSAIINNMGCAKIFIAKIIKKA